MMNMNVRGGYPRGGGCCGGGSRQPCQGAVRCVALCSALRCPVQRAAMACAPHCAICLGILPGVGRCRKPACAPVSPVVAKASHGVARCCAASRPCPRGMSVRPITRVPPAVADGTFVSFIYNPHCSVKCQGLSCTGTCCTLYRQWFSHYSASTLNSAPLAKSLPWWLESAVKRR